MSQGWYPPAQRLPITTQEYYTTRAVPLISIVDHITDGTDSRDYLQHADNKSSVHFLIRAEGGRAVVYQFMPVEWTAWGNGRYSKNNPYMPAWVQNLIDRDININSATVSIEHERKWPFSTLPPEVMVEASIALHKWLADTYPTIRRDRDHILGHYQIDHIDRANCPGGPGGRLFPFDRILAALNAPAPESQAFPETGQAVRGEIYRYFVRGGGVGEFGFPITAEYQAVLEDGLEYTCQLFQKALLHYRPDQGVGRANIGTMYGRLKGLVA